MLHLNTTQITLPEQESLPSREMPVYVAIQEGPRRDDIYPYGSRDFIEDRFIQNIALLGTLGYIHPTPDRFDIEEVLYPLFEPDVIESVTSLQAIPVYKQLEAKGLIPHNQTYCPRNLAEAVVSYSRLFEARGDTRFIPIHSSHVTGLALLEALEAQGLNPKKVVLAVVDAHTDTWGLPHMQNHHTKAGFLRALIAKGYHAMVLGADEIERSDKRERMLVSETGRDYPTLARFGLRIRQGNRLNTKATEAYMRATNSSLFAFEDRSQHARKHESQLSILPFSQMKDMQPQQIQDYLSKQFAKVSRLGVDTLFISFDLDVLDLYTNRIYGTAYSHMARAVAAGIADYSRYLTYSIDQEKVVNLSVGQYCMLVEEFITLRNKGIPKSHNPTTGEVLSEILRITRDNSASSTLQKIHGLRREVQEEAQLDFLESKRYHILQIILSQIASNLLERINYIDPETDNLYGVTGRKGRVLYVGRKGGLQPQKAVDLIRTIKEVALKNGIKVGVQLQRGGNCLGSINECVGYDPNGATADVVKLILDTLRE